MRTNIVLDDELIEAARKATGLKTKKAVVEEALRRLLKGSSQIAAIKELKGMADWEGDIRKLRENREIPRW